VLQEDVDDLLPQFVVLDFVDFWEPAKQLLTVKIWKIVFDCTSRS
jgi:hypothetical protein